MTTQDEAMRARVDGRMSVAERTIWRLEIGNGAMAVRCLDNGYGKPVTIQMRGSNGWRDVPSSIEKAHDALLNLASLGTMKDAIASARHRIWRTR